METAKIFENGESQAIQLPPKHHFVGNEVYVQKVGKAVVLMPKDSVWEIFMDGVNSFTDDFFANGRDSGLNTARGQL